jgi:hypothetical protein
VSVVWCDELPSGFGWKEPGRLERASHTLLVDGGVWLIDPLDGPGVEKRLRGLGEPAGVVQLLDRHGRACAGFAERLAVPLHRVPFEGGIPGSPFEVRRAVNLPGWREAALWWAEGEVLVCADAVGTARYFRAPGEPLGVHPLLRLLPPRSLRDMARGLTPSHVLCGHGTGIHGEAAALALHEALTTARARIPRYLTGLARGRS